MGNIDSVTPIGKHQTYDVEVDHPDHQFYLANGVLTSNSHAVAYAINSYATAFLLTHHESEWISACLEAAGGAKKSKVIADVQRLKYKISSVDVNNSDEKWRVDKVNRLIYPSLLSCKKVGEAAVRELMSLRPFSSLEDLFYNPDGSWRLSKFNKSAMSALVKVKALESLGCVGEGKMFSSYRGLCDVVENHWNDLKKHLKRNPLEGRQNLLKFAEEARSTPEWTRAEHVNNQVEVYGALDVFTLVSPETLAKFIDYGVRSIDELEDEECDVVWYAVSSQTTQLTKNNKPFLKLHVSSPSNKMFYVKVWPKKGSTELIDIPKYSVCMSKVTRDSWGMSTNAAELMIVADNL